MKSRIAWLAAAAGVAGAAAYRTLRRKQTVETDPRAEDLRRKLDESRPEEDEEPEESAETTIDQAEPEPEPEVGVEDKRQTVHDRGRAAADEMRSRSSE